MLAVKADVWVLTETHDLLSLSDDGYRAVHAEQRPVGDGANKNVVEGSRWVSIWSGPPIRKTITDLPDPRRSAACVIEANGQDLLVFGTVLPWTGDTETGGIESVLKREGPKWQRLHKQYGAACVAGDFNVNLGGPHYYGSNASKAAVSAALAAASLVPVTDFGHTPGRKFGLVDHIAVSAGVADTARLSEIWGERTEDDEYLSDHSGVAIDVSAW